MLTRVGASLPDAFKIDFNHWTWYASMISFELYKVGSGQGLLPDYYHAAVDVVSDYMMWCPWVPMPSAAGRCCRGG